MARPQEIDAVMQVLGNYMATREALQQKQRQDDMWKMLKTGMDTGELQSSFNVGKDGSVSMSFTPKKVEKPKGAYEDTAQWKKEDATKRLVTEYLKAQYPNASQGEGHFEPYERWTDYAGPFKGKAEYVRRFFMGNPHHKTKEGKVDAAAMFRDLGITIEDIRVWSLENQPELAEVAFPAEKALRKDQKK